MRKQLLAGTFTVLSLMLLSVVSIREFTGYRALSANSIPGVTQPFDYPPRDAEYIFYLCTHPNQLTMQQRIRRQQVLGGTPHLVLVDEYNLYCRENSGPTNPLDSCIMPPTSTLSNVRQTRHNDIIFTLNTICPRNGGLPLDVFEENDGCDGQLTLTSGGNKVYMGRGIICRNGTHSNPKSIPLAHHRIQDLNAAATLEYCDTSNRCVSKLVELCNGCLQDPPGYVLTEATVEQNQKIRVHATTVLEKSAGHCYMLHALDGQNTLLSESALCTEENYSLVYDVPDLDLLKDDIKIKLCSQSHLDACTNAVPLRYCDSSCIEVNVITFFHRNSHKSKQWFTDRINDCEDALGSQPQVPTGQFTQHCDVTGDSKISQEDITPLRAHLDTLPDDEPTHPAGPELTVHEFSLTDDGVLIRYTCNDPTQYAEYTGQIGNEIQTLIRITCAPPLLEYEVLIPYQELERNLTVADVITWCSQNIADNSKECHASSIVEEKRTNPQSGNTCGTECIRRNIETLLDLFRQDNLEKLAYAQEELWHLDKFTSDIHLPAQTYGYCSFPRQTLVGGEHRDITRDTPGGYRFRQCSVDQTITYSTNHRRQAFLAGELKHFDDYFEANPAEKLLATQNSRDIHVHGPNADGAFWIIGGAFMAYENGLLTENNGGNALQYALSTPAVRYEGSIKAQYVFDTVAPGKYQLYHKHNPIVQDKIQGSILVVNDPDPYSNGKIFVPVGDPIDPSIVNIWAGKHHQLISDGGGRQVESVGMGDGQWYYVGDEFSTCEPTHVAVDVWRGDEVKLPVQDLRLIRIGEPTDCHNFTPTEPLPDNAHLENTGLDAVLHEATIQNGNLVIEYSAEKGHVPCMRPYIVRNINTSPYRDSLPHWYPHNGEICNYGVNELFYYRVKSNYERIISESTGNIELQLCHYDDDPDITYYPDRFKCTNSVTINGSRNTEQIPWTNIFGPRQIANKHLIANHGSSNGDTVVRKRGKWQGIQLWTNATRATPGDEDTDAEIDFVFKNVGRGRYKIFVEGSRNPTVPAKDTPVSVTVNGVTQNHVVDFSSNYTEEWGEDRFLLGLPRRWWQVGNELEVCSPDELTVSLSNQFTQGYNLQLRSVRLVQVDKAHECTNSRNGRVVACEDPSTTDANLDLECTDLELVSCGELENYRFSEDTKENFNSYGLQEQRFRVGPAQFLFILPNGDVYLWDNADARDNSAEAVFADHNRIAKFPEVYYTDFSKLYAWDGEAACLPIEIVPKPTSSSSSSTASSDSSSSVAAPSSSSSSAGPSSSSSSSAPPAPFVELATATYTIESKTVEVQYSTNRAGMYEIYSKGAKLLSMLTLDDVTNGTATLTIYNGSDHQKLELGGEFRICERFSSTNCSQTVNLSVITPPPPPEKLELESAVYTSSRKELVIRYSNSVSGFYDIFVDGTKLNVYRVTLLGDSEASLHTISSASDQALFVDGARIKLCSQIDPLECSDEIEIEFVRPAPPAQISITNALYNTDTFLLEVNYSSSIGSLFDIYLNGSKVANSLIWLEEKNNEQAAATMTTTTDRNTLSQGGTIKLCKQYSVIDCSNEIPLDVYVPPPPPPACDQDCMDARTYDLIGSANPGTYSPAKAQAAETAILNGTTDLRHDLNDDGSVTSVDLNIINTYKTNHIAQLLCQFSGADDDSPACDRHLYELLDFNRDGTFTHQRVDHIKQWCETKFGLIHTACDVDINNIVDTNDINILLIYAAANDTPVIDNPLQNEIEQNVLALFSSLELAKEEMVSYCENRMPGTDNGKRNACDVDNDELILSVDTSYIRAYAPPESEPPPPPPECDQACRDARTYDLIGSDAAGTYSPAKATAAQNAITNGATDLKYDLNDDGDITTADVNIINTYKTNHPLRRLCTFGREAIDDTAACASHLLDVMDFNRDGSFTLRRLNEIGEWCQDRLGKSNRTCDVNLSGAIDDADLRIIETYGDAEDSPMRRDLRNYEIEDNVLLLFDQLTLVKEEMIAECESRKPGSSNHERDLCDVDDDEMIKDRDLNFIDQYAPDLAPPDVIELTRAVYFFGNLTFTFTDTANENEYFIFANGQQLQSTWAERSGESVKVLGTDGQHVTQGGDIKLCRMSDITDCSNTVQVSSGFDAQSVKEREEQAPDICTQIQGYTFTSGNLRFSNQLGVNEYWFAHGSEWVLFTSSGDMYLWNNETDPAKIFVEQQRIATLPVEYYIDLTLLYNLDCGGSVPSTDRLELTNAKYWFGRLTLTYSDSKNERSFWIFIDGARLTNSYANGSGEQADIGGNDSNRIYQGADIKICREADLTDCSNTIQITNS